MTWRLGEVIDGRYEVTDVHEHGAMGVVYRVRHFAWNIDLAMKSPRPELLRSAEGQRRFVAEAETWVSLGLHPHVCNCYYVRVLDGVPQVFAEYVPGGSLHEWISDRRLYDGEPPEVLTRILDIAIQTAWGLDHAHDHGLVHRDVKPANVLLDLEDSEADADGTAGAVTAKITDFGLARARAMAASVGTDVPPGASILVPGGGGMTPRYASPEQAEEEPVGRRTDIYSFAVSVLEMCVGEVTWMAGSAAGAALTSYLVGEEEAGAVVIPPALGGLLQRCLRHDPDDRPKSMAKVAAELIEIYQSVTGQTYPRPAPATADLLCDELNNRAASMLDLDRQAEADDIFAQALEVDPQNVRAVYNSGLARWRRGAVTDSELVSEIEAVRADADDPWEARYALAQIHLVRGDLATARELLDGLGEERPDEPEVRAALHAIRSGEVIDARCVREWPVRWPPQPPSRSGSRAEDEMALALSPDGRFALSGGRDGLVLFWDVHSGRCVSRLEGHNCPVRAVDLTPDGRFAVSVCADDNVCFWELRHDSGGPGEGRHLPTRLNLRADTMSFTVARASEGTTIRLTPDGSFVLYAGSDGVFRAWNPHNGLTRALDVFAAGGLVDVSADGRRVLSVGWRGRTNNRERVVRLWDRADGSCLRELTMGPEHEEHMAGDPEPERLECLDSTVTALCLSADGRLAATGHYGEIRVWDLADGRRLRVLRGNSTAVGLAFSSDARFLLSGARSSGNVVQLWELDSGRCVRTFPAHQGDTTVVRLDADARFGLSFGQDGTVRRWRLPGGYRGVLLMSRPRRHVELNQLGGQVGALVAGANRWMAAGRFPVALDLLQQARAVEGYERAPRVMSAWWALARRAVRTELRAAWSSQTWEGGLPTAVDLSHDGRLAVSADDTGAIQLWDPSRGTCLRVLEGHWGSVGSVGLSADGRWVLSSSVDGMVRLWEVGTGTCRHILTEMKGLTKGVRDLSLPVRFSADGTHAVIGGSDGRVQLWELETGRLTRELRDAGTQVYGTGIYDLCVSEDGQRAAAAGYDSVHGCGRVDLWDLAAGRIVHRLSLERPALLPRYSVSLSADGRFVLGGDGHDLRLWDTATGENVRTFDRLPDGEADSDIVRLTADGRFAVSGGDRPALWDVHSGGCIRTLGHSGVHCLAVTPDGRFVLTGERTGNLRLWELDWELDARDAAAWDDGAAPYLEAFLHRHGSRWTDEDFDALSHRLQDVGYGWLRDDGVRDRLDRMTESRVDR